MKTDPTLQELQLSSIMGSLQTKSIKINPTDPFTWASGYRMPIYNDNRMLLAKPTIRRIVGSGLVKLIEKLGVEPDFIAGTATAGIPWATIVATKMSLPMVYIRDKPKDHGLMNRIEGLDATQDFAGAKVIVIEDLISTGESSAKAVQAVLDANGDVLACISIFNYGFPKAQQLFAELDPPCRVASLITYPMLIEQARSLGYVRSSEMKMLQDWNNDPFNWGQKNGFPKIEK